MAQEEYSQMVIDTARVDSTTHFTFEVVAIAIHVFRKVLRHFLPNISNKTRQQIAKPYHMRLVPGACRLRSAYLSLKSPSTS